MEPPPKSATECPTLGPAHTINSYPLVPGIVREGDSGAYH